MVDTCIFFDFNVQSPYSVFYVDFTIQLQFQLYKDLNVCLNKMYYNFCIVFIRKNIKKNKIKLLTLESHFIKSESFDQASLHATILVGFLGILDFKKKSVI